jgi:beta-N-acetylglucosaminidase
MEEIYLHIKGNNIKGYYSFSRLCKENGIDKDKVNKDMLPLQIGKDIKIVKISIDTRI